MKAGRYEIKDFEWSIIEPLLPNKPWGVPRVDDRRVLNGIFWRLARPIWLVLCCPTAEGGKNTRHFLSGLLRQSVFGRLAGYEGVNDADCRAHDPAMRVVVGRDGLDSQAASTSQMGRLGENISDASYCRGS